MAKRGHRPLGYEVIREDCNAHKRILEFVKSQLERQDREDA